MTKLMYLFFSVINRFVHSQILQRKVDTLAYNIVINNYKLQGAIIGKNTIIIDTKFSSSSKGDRFFIGENCTITGSTLLGHDASPTLHIEELVIHKESFRKGSRRSYRSPITIGNNVFIGWGSIILPGVEIGNNCVIGAGSVVSKSIPADMVAAGNPARVIKSTDDYIKSYRRRLEEEPDNF
ncbi:DapH/DapD/GlmU-related protein [Pseudoalteromonas sp. TB64]|uniref:acyltransferase n=1 Tax=Pseudoalteromonas sp. TB64 TaxID=1938600 RepID=UPI000421E428|nr:DapH/DapD/GlmU-related protein [Pseudoalteromonas sp. TB64]